VPRFRFIGFNWIGRNGTPAKEQPKAQAIVNPLNML